MNIVHNQFSKKLSLINDKTSEIQLKEGEKDILNNFEEDKTTVFNKSELKKKLMKSRSRHNHFKES